MNQTPFSADNNLYLLSLLDTSDRLNILLLEVRHLQQSIIDLLHDPTLYLLLRYEENYIFGGWETNEAISKKLKGKSASEITKASIIRYPSPRRAVKFWTKNERDGETGELEEKILNRIGEIWTGDTWVRGERQHYHALRALQILKQQIFRDKVLLFKQARKMGLIQIESDEKANIILDKSAFLIFRRGVHYRLDRYISSMKTQQQNFAKSLDFGLQRDPRPCIDRRREIGIFNDFLSNRMIDLQADTLHLMSKITDTQEQELRSKSPMLLHGWSQLMHVRNHPLWDDVGRELDNDVFGAESEWRQDVCYIDTSFWSPDRPDLQPLVAKEIVYSVMRTLSQGFSDDYFSNEKNQLSKLWVTLSKVINDYSDNRSGLEPIRAKSEYLVRSLIVDSMAASVKGISYLYALFFSENSLGLENLLRVDRTIRLEYAAELEFGIGAYEQYFEWYFRLRFTTYWLRKVSGFKHLELSELDNTVLDGVEIICESMIRFLDAHNISATRKPVSREWRALYEEIEKSVELLPIWRMVKEWREKRSKDTWNEINNRSGRKEYHRSTMPLDIRLQNFLCRETIRHKREKHKVLCEKPDDNLLDEFCLAYGLTPKEVRIPYAGGNVTVRQPNHLYRQLHDIPFQCSIMRSIDILGRCDNERHKLPKWRSFVSHAHDDMGLGREIFSFALEFYTWRRESPKSRLLLSINLLNFSLPTLKMAESQDIETVVKAFEHWLYAGYQKPIEIVDKASKLVKSLENCDYRKVLCKYACGKKGELDECISEVGAVSIDDALAQGGGGADVQRRLEQIAGYKIKELSRLCDEYVQPYIEHRKVWLEKLEDSQKRYVDDISLLGNLRHFLSIRDDSINQPASLGRFYNLLFKAFDGGDSISHYYQLPQRRQSKRSSNFVGKSIQVASKAMKNRRKILLTDLESKDNLPRAIKPIIVSRLSLTSFYTIANPKSLSPKKEVKNALGLFQALKKEHWYRKDTGSQYSVVLGRYDVVSLTKTKLPCLCRISCFGDVPDPDSGKGSEINTLNERFATHFARREVAFPVQIYGKYEFEKVSETGESNANSDTHTIYAIASISLQRRSMRLNLLYRLLNALEQGDECYATNSIEEHIRALIKMPIGKDLAITGLLTDGWGDLLLVFMVKKNTDVGHLYEKILDLQQAFYEDFMVDRTELIYTPQCLDNMLKSHNYLLSFLFRFQEDRKLECGMSNFAAALRKKAEKLPSFITAEKAGDLDILFTPGQYDIRVNLNIDINQKLENVYNKLLSWFADTEIKSGEVLFNEWYKDGLSFIDSIETSIERGNH